MALAHVQQYLQTNGHLLLVQQLTETALRNWLERLAEVPTARGAVRSASTIETYARSERAFCGWLVEQGMLPSSPLHTCLFPRTSVPLPPIVSPTTFAQISRAGFAQRVQGRGARHLIARDRALLWVLIDTGITVTEACALRMADLDEQHGLLRIRGKGGKERQMSLGDTCWSHLRSYLRQLAPATRWGLSRRHTGGDPLFGSKGKEPLTRNGVTTVFARFRKRAGISEPLMTPQILRHSVALRYLQTGGNSRRLQELLGYTGMAPVRQYLRWYEQMREEQRQQEGERPGKA